MSESKKMYNNVYFDHTEVEWFDPEWQDEDGDPGCFVIIGDREANSMLPQAILMQYTGLKDKTGREIFEGDIVRCSLPTKWGLIVRNGEVRSENLGHCMVSFNEVDGLPLDDAIYMANRQGVEIIGNIFESPDLLEKN